MFEKEPDIAAISKKTGITYDDLQAEAIRTAVHNKVMVLTGGPGTGKTTTEDGIIAVFKEMGLHILLAAPTGRAAKRMTEATGMEAKTIHRLLDFNPAEGYKRTDENPLEGDALIIDECSMIDIVLMNSLLKAVPSDMRLLLVGDVDQLPSVGAGNVLRDVIDSGVVPVVRLTRIFRQAQTSRIIMNAHAINEGRMPDIRNGKLPGFYTSIDDLRQLWADPKTREQLMEKLGQAGYDMEVLNQIRHIIDADNSDLLDVLEYISYAIPPIERKQRAERARDYRTELSPDQQAFVDYLILAYINNGVKELSNKNLPGLIAQKFDDLQTGLNRLGGVSMARKIYSTFQQRLYLQ